MNPFDVESHQLFRIASGAPAPPGICEDIMDAETKGKHAKDSFITERLKKDKEFFEPIKRLKLKTFADMSKKVTVKTSSNREIEDRQQGNVAFQLLVLSQNQTEKLDMKELLRYPLMLVPSSIGTPDGFLLKTDKSKAFSHLTKGITDAVPPPDHATLNIEDGNATFYCMTDVPTSFKQIGEKLLDMSTGGKSKVVFSTDMYKDDSIKSMERRRRGCGEKRIIQGENTTRPENWKVFLSNDDNKQQLIALLLKIWSSPECSRKLQKKEVIAICEGKAYLLTSDGKTVEKSEILTLESDQEETDTRVVLYCSFAEQEKDQFVRVRSPDSDIFFILLYYASNFNIRILFDTGSGNRRRLLDVTGMSKDFTPMYCAALLGLHAFTRCDTTSAFKGIGKVKPLKLLQQKPRYQEVFQSLGTTWRIPNELYQGLEEFTCNMYKRTTKSSAVNELRYEMIASKCGGQTGLEIKLERKVDLSSLPPPRSCLNEHIRRVNYQVGIWKRAHIPKPIIPEATDDHGWVKCNCQIEPKWSAGDVIPPKLAAVLEKMECDDDAEEAAYVRGQKGRLSQKTLCMIGEQDDGKKRHYDVHSLYGWSQTLPTLIAAQNATKERSMVVTRSTFVSSGRYAGHWLGDNTSEWPFMHQSIVGMLEFNLFGIPYVGADICGFFGNTTNDLCLRWMQLGAFYPFCRNHNGIGYINQDPGALGKEVAEASRIALNIRYTLLPYLYTLLFEANQHGSTVVRPLFHEFPTDENTYDLDAQFLWGPALMIAPVLEQNSLFHQGPMNTSKDVSGNKMIPLFIRSGHIIPTQDTALNTVKARKNPLSLIIATKGSRSCLGNLFWDDGISIDTIEKKNFHHFNFNYTKNTLVIDRTNSYKNSVTLKLDKLKILGMTKKPKMVLINNQPVVVNINFNKTLKVVEIQGMNLVLTKDVTKWKIDMNVS
ncbi:Sucrase-isomaltase, intestinal [Nymphon striatum]|nr:Sucrase-isomaltase, intestinal [Nymphon striatum]